MDGPRGVRLMRYSQSYFLETDPSYGLSYVSGLAIQLEARVSFQTVQRAYSARVLEVEFFFASAADQAEFEKQRARHHLTADRG